MIWKIFLQFAIYKVEIVSSEMPLVVMCGYPCSGKSKRAEELKSYFENSKRKTVHMTGDENIDLKRNVVYAGNLNLFNQ